MNFQKKNIVKIKRVIELENYLFNSKKNISRSFSWILEKTAIAIELLLKIAQRHDFDRTKLYNTSHFIKQKCIIAQ